MTITIFSSAAQLALNVKRGALARSVPSAACRCWRCHFGQENGVVPRNLAFAKFTSFNPTDDTPPNAPLPDGPLANSFASAVASSRPHNYVYLF